MAFLEEKRFIHRDLRAVNVLVGPRNSIKVADFGMSRQLSSNEDNSFTTRHYKTNDPALPYRWTAPECFQYTGNVFVFTSKVLP